MANNTQIAGLFDVVAADEVPTNIRRSRNQTTQWQTAITQLRELEVGRAIALTVYGDQEKARTRQNMISANNAISGRTGVKMSLRTRSVPLTDKAGDPIVNDEGSRGYRMFFLYTEDVDDDADGE